MATYRVHQIWDYTWRIVLWLGLYSCLVVPSLLYGDFPWKYTSLHGVVQSSHIVNTTCPSTPASCYAIRVQLHYTIDARVYPYTYVPDSVHPEFVVAQHESNTRYSNGTHLSTVTLYCRSDRPAQVLLQLDTQKDNAGGFLLGAIFGMFITAAIALTIDRVCCGASRFRRVHSFDWV